MKVNDLRTLIETGAALSFCVFELEDGKWGLDVETRTRTYLLTTKDGAPRHFATLDTAIGVVEACGWSGEVRVLVGDGDDF